MIVLDRIDNEHALTTGYKKGIQRHWKDFLMGEREGGTVFTKILEWVWHRLKS